MPDLDELVEQVRSSLTEGAGFQALSARFHEA